MSTLTQSLPDRSTTRVSNRFFHWTMTWLVLALILFAILGLKASGYVLPITAALSIALAGLPCGIVALYCVWTKNTKMREAALMVLWAGLLASLLQFPMYVAARFHFTLRDEALRSVDRRLGFEVPTVLSWTAHHSHVASAFAFIYNLLIIMMFAAAAIPGIAGKFTAAKQFIISTSFASILVAPLSAVLPAIGPWTVYHYPPSASQAATQHLLLVLRASGVHVINTNDSGIICFPSFHVVLAMLSAWALWSVPKLRIPVAALTTLIVISTMTTGWHYFTDILGGVALTVMSMAVAKAYTRIERSPSSR